MSAEVTIPSRRLPPLRRADARMLLRDIANDSRQSSVLQWPQARLEKLTAAGLGPILYRLAGKPNGGSPAAEVLLGADLTARLIAGAMIEAVEDILRAAGPDATEIVLLKGAAAGHAHYPEPHLRVMGDIDLLAGPGTAQRLHSILGELGYVQQSHLPAAFFETHHHAMPFFHPKMQIWVELHHALLPANWAPAADADFATAAVLASTVPLVYSGIGTRRLRDELHLIYTCTHWAGSFSLERGIVAMTDIIYLLARNPAFDWDVLLRQMPSGWAARSVSLLLGYLCACSAIQLNSEVARFVATSLRSMGRANVRLLWWLLDTRMIERRFERLWTEANAANLWDALLLREGAPLLNMLRLPFVLLFPPNRADRFHPSLAARRIRSLLGGDDEH